MKYLFGPVPSRRLGLSLGVDLIPPKTCTLDCIYCEVGRTTHKTLERQEFYPTGDIIREICDYLQKAEILPDHITLAGSGEPTLHLGLGDLIRALKQETAVPVAVLTNGTLLFLPEVRQELLPADVILPSLDTVSPAIFRSLNRPAAGLTVESLIAGLEALRREYAGQIWLEVLLLRGINDGPADLEQLRQVIANLQPDKVQLNTAVRPVVEEYAQPLTPAQLAEAARLLGAEVEIIADFSPLDHPHVSLSDAAFLDTLARRPLTAQDLADLLGLPLVQVIKKLEHLTSQGLVSYTVHQHRGFYQKTG
jgi:wyosine [tRNA(Phe)-imidazoG37] synthetase (radical SAM superfamily)